MKRNVCTLLCLLIIVVSLVACTKQNEKPEPTTAIETTQTGGTDQTGGTNETDVNEIIDSDKGKGINNNEYAIYVGDNYYPLHDPIFETILEDAKSEDVPEDFPYPAGKTHYGDELTISTFMVDDERGKGEVIYNILAKKDAKTPRGVGIGDSLSDLQVAYSDLNYEADWSWTPDNDSPKFNRVYIYSSEGSRTYIAFFLYESEIVMIEVAEGFDVMPGANINESNLLGVTGVLKETNDMTSKGANIKYFYTNEAGEEEILIDLKARSVYETDIDDDGITELVVYLPGDMQSIRIYDSLDGTISFIDVDKKLDSLWSSGLEGMSNLKNEYRKFVLVGFQNEDGTQRLEIYKVEDNELFYVGPFSDDVLM